MKKALLVTIIVIAVLLMISCENTTNPMDSNAQTSGERSLAKKGGATDCLTITGGDIYYRTGHYLAGEPIPTGYDVYGYNYQGHMFKGSYANTYLGGYGFPPYTGDDEAYLAENPTVVSQWYWPYRMYEIQMKWNDAWLSNKDCDGDGALDRYYGYDSYIGSGAWEKYSEKMGGPDGYTYTSKIVAVPEDAVLDGAIWYTADGKEIGYEIWGAFAIIQEVQGGSGVTEHGLLYAGEDHLGLGGW